VLKCEEKNRSLAMLNDFLLLRMEAIPVLVNLMKLEVEMVKEPH